jgi:integrase
MNERIIQKVAGHASLEMTRHYNRSTRLQEDFSLDEMDRICGFKKA